MMIDTAPSRYAATPEKSIVWIEVRLRDQTAGGPGAIVAVPIPSSLALRLEAEVLLAVDALAQRHGVVAETILESETGSPAQLVRHQRCLLDEDGDAFRLLRQADPRPIAVPEHAR